MSWLSKIRGRPKGNEKSSEDPGAAGKSDPNGGMGRDPVEFGNGYLSFVNQKISN